MTNVQSEEDTTERVLKCNLGHTKFNLNDKKVEPWGEMVKIYRKNKKEQINR